MRSGKRVALIEIEEDDVERGSGEFSDISACLVGAGKWDWRRVEADVRAHA